MKQRTQHGLVLLAAASAALALFESQTHWLSPNAQPIERERCYGVVRAGANDCANAKHSCAAQASTQHDSKEWIMLPKGVCTRLADGALEAS